MFLWQDMDNDPCYPFLSGAPINLNDLKKICFEIILFGIKDV